MRFPTFLKNFGALQNLPVKTRSNNRNIHSLRGYDKLLPQLFLLSYKAIFKK
jgi:hypothetical protein